MLQCFDEMGFTIHVLSRASGPDQWPVLATTWAARR
jgi:hypothetical protein